MPTGRGQLVLPVKLFADLIESCGGCGRRLDARQPSLQLEPAVVVVRGRSRLTVAVRRQGGLAGSVVRGGRALGRLRETCSRTGDWFMNRGTLKCWMQNRVWREVVFHCPHLTRVLPVVWDESVQLCAGQVLLCRGRAARGAGLLRESPTLILGCHKVTPEQGLGFWRKQRGRAGEGGPTSADTGMGGAGEGKPTPTQGGGTVLIN